MKKTDVPLRARAASEPDFYQLGFASQMIVWAARKRLHLLAHGESEDNVIDAFGIAGFDEIHASLMHVLDVLLCGASNRVQLHAVACPCLSAHEVSLLNALAYLQRRDRVGAERCLGQLFCATAARLVEPAVRAIVAELDERGLRLTLVGDACTATTLPRRSLH